MGPKVSEAIGKMVIGRNFGVGYLSSFLLAVASAAEPAQADVALRYEAATVSVTVTSQEAQRPSFHVVSVRPSGRLPSALKRPRGSLIEGYPALESEHQIRSFTK